MHYTTYTSEIKLKSDQSVDRHVLIGQPKLGSDLKSILDRCQDTLPLGDQVALKILIGKRLDMLYVKSQEHYIKELQRIIFVLRDYNHGSINESELFKSINPNSNSSGIIDFVSKGINGTVPAAFVAGLHSALSVS